MNLLSGSLLAVASYSLQRPRYRLIFLPIAVP